MHQKYPLSINGTSDILYFSTNIHSHSELKTSSGLLARLKEIQSWLVDFLLSLATLASKQNEID